MKRDQSTSSILTHSYYSRARARRLVEDHISILEQLERSHKQAQEAMLKRQDELQAQITEMMELLLVKGETHPAQEANTDATIGGFGGAPVEELSTHSLS